MPVLGPDSSYYCKNAVPLKSWIDIGYTFGKEQRFEIMKRVLILIFVLGIIRADAQTARMSADMFAQYAAQYNQSMQPGTIAAAQSGLQVGIVDTPAPNIFVAGQKSTANSVVVQEELLAGRVGDEQTAQGGNKPVRKKIQLLPRKQ